MRGISVTAFIVLLSICCLTVCVTSVASNAEPRDKCLALCLSGGGDKGAYEAGVIYGLVNNLPTNESQYQIISGISAGAILTAAMATFNIGDEIAMADFVYVTALNLTQAQIFREWPGGMLDGLANHTSLFDSTPLVDTLTNLLGDRPISNRQIFLGAVNVSNGNLVTFCSDNLIDGAVASAAIPGILNARIIDGTEYIDGGTVYGINVYSAIDACQQAGYADQDIIIDMVSTSGSSLPIATSAPSHTLDVMLRALAIREYASDMRTINDMKNAFPNIMFRYEIFPSVPLPGIGLDFNSTQMQFMADQGIKDAQNAIQQQIKW